MSFTTLLVMPDAHPLSVTTAELAFLSSSTTRPDALSDGMVDPTTAAELALACGARGLWTLRSFLLEAARSGGFTVQVASQVPAQRQPRHRPYPVYPFAGDVAGER